MKGVAPACGGSGNVGDVCRGEEPLGCGCFDWKAFAGVLGYRILVVVLIATVATGGIVLLAQTVASVAGKYATGTESWSGDEGLV